MTVSPQMARLLHTLSRPVPPRRYVPAGGLMDCAAHLGLDGLALSLSRGKDGIELLRHTSDTAAALEDVQFTQGQGPSTDADRSGQPVLEPDLAASPNALWPGLLPSFLQLRVRAVFAFPLRLGAIHLGVLTAHRAAPGPLSPQQTADALALTQTLTHLLTARAVNPGAPADRFADVSDLHRAELHQATGMTAVQLGIGLEDALIRIRGHAYRHNQPLLHTAQDILSGRLRLEGNSHPTSADGA